ncbi:unnamed protein product [Sphagnum balticum]
MAEACEKLRQELSAADQAKLCSHTLDISDAKSCANLAQFLKKEHGGIDVLVNNAGIAFKARITNATNYFGLRNICDALFPLLRANGRVVNVESKGGIMKGRGYSEANEQLLKSPTLTIPQIDAFVNTFIEHATRGDHVAAGYRDSAYGVSKAAGIALSVVQQRAFDGDKTRTGILVNAVRVSERCMNQIIEIIIAVLPRLRGHGHDQSQGPVDNRSGRRNAGVVGHVADWCDESGGTVLF